MATYEEEKFGKHFLDDVKEFVVDYFDIHELYSNEQIETWVKQNSDFISERFDISEIYTDRYIKSWMDDCAKDYGYVKED